MADNVTTEELELALQQLAEGMGLSVVEYVQGLGYATVADVESDVNGLQSQINAILELDAENGVESLAEKVNAINAVISDENGVIQAIYTKIQENTQEILNETLRATGVEADLQAQITSAVNAGNTNATAITSVQTALTALTGRVTLTEADIATLKGDETVAGSIANLIKVETDRAVAKEAENRALIDINTAKTADLQSQINNLTGGTSGSISEVSERVTVIEDTLNDTTDENGDLVKGIKTRLSDVESGLASEIARATAREDAVLAEAKAYTDANVLKASSMDVCSIGNKFRFALGLADKTCGGTGGGEPEGDGMII
jgi:hypothetical protein